MEEKVLIFGKNTWPFTTEAREAYLKNGRNVEYIDVLSDAGNLDTMLKYSDGKRKVPIVVDRGEVTIGFNGKAWRI